MFNYMRRLGAVLMTLILVQGCGDDDDEIVNAVLKGATFTSLEVESADFFLCASPSSYTMRFEVDAGSDQLKNVTVYMAFVDNTVDGITYTTAEEQVAIIDASSFANGPNNLPTATFSIDVQDVLTQLNLADYNLEDEFRIRFEIHLTDGRTFTSESSSQFVYYAGVAPPPIDEPDFLTGQYVMDQLSGSDPFFASETFGDGQVVNIVADGARRSFDFLYYPGIFDSDYNFEMILACGEVLVKGTINAGGLGCGGANIGFATGDPVSSYDQNFVDDDVILLNVTDFKPDGNCDTGGYQVQLRFTKQ